MPAPFVTTQKLRFCDTDRLGHVNNAVYAVMYEAGRGVPMDVARATDFYRRAVAAGDPDAKVDLSRLSPQ